MVVKIEKMPTQIGEEAKVLRIITIIRNVTKLQRKGQQVFLVENLRKISGKRWENFSEARAVLKEGIKIELLVRSEQNPKLFRVYPVIIRKLGVAPIGKQKVGVVALEIDFAMSYNEATEKIVHKGGFIRRKDWPEGRALGTISEDPEKNLWIKTGDKFVKCKARHINPAEMRIPDWGCFSGYEDWINIKIEEEE